MIDLPRTIRPRKKKASFEPPIEGGRGRLLESFVRLCEIPSPFGRERQVAEALKAELNQLGLDVVEDDAASTSGSECGNLFTRIGGPPGVRTVLLCAHIDTVPLLGPVEVVEYEGVLSNAHNAALGADNKAAVAVFLEIARHYSATQPPVGIELLFTVSEENGLAGAKAFDLGQLQSDFGFVFDHASPIGELLVAAPTHKRLTAEFIGRSAHAGIRPEQGTNAIAAAAKAIESMRLGRLDHETTANVGTIEGGSAVNVVPERCTLTAEARSLDNARALEVIQEMVDACNWAAGTTSTDAKVLIEDEFKAYRLDNDAPSVRAAAAAMRDVGIEPSLVPTGGGSDANVFMAEGLECLNVANGTEANHTPEERVSVAALENMLEFCHRLLARCAGFGDLSAEIGS